ncbi:MAG: DTW domain-containing protein [Alphaproteobacteria bacterium]|nr:DTW domain-containing protein [Alphaproteobacteria bacterium]
MEDNANSSVKYCEKCDKPIDICVCSNEEKAKNKVFVLILQHPQEQDKLLGTAKILTDRLENSQLVVALSRPGLKSILKKDVDPKKWGVLYLGAQKEKPIASGLYALDKNGMICPNKDEILKSLEGIILLDGSWDQAKKLWWRNPWLLKVRRLVLVPEKKSMYGKLRKEPRHESVSTLEATAMCLTALGEDKSIEEMLLNSFGKMLEKYKAHIAK